MQCFFKELKQTILQHTILGITNFYYYRYIFNIEDVYYFMRRSTYVHVLAYYTWSTLFQMPLTN